jgi:hypothetical protein
MSLIDASYFYGNLNIAQLNQKSVTDSLQYFIDMYEREFLTKVLGLQLYDAFILGMAATPPVDAKWQWLMDGGNYTGYNGYPKFWVGFYNNANYSPIACYIYYHYMRDLQTQSMGAGEAKATVQNAISASVSQKCADAWNLMGSQVENLFEYLNINNDALYPEWMYGAQSSANSCWNAFGKMNTIGI